MTQYNMIKQLWKLFDAIYYRDESNHYSMMYMKYHINAKCSNKSIKDICDESLQQNHKFILIIEKGVVPLNTITYFGLLDILNYMKVNKSGWDILSLGSQPHILNEDLMYVDEHLYKNNTNTNYSYILNEEGMKKLKEKQENVNVLHHYPNYFRPANFGLFDKLKYWYATSISIPIVYIPFIIMIYLIKYYIFQYNRRQGNVNVFVELPTESIVENSNVFRPNNLLERRHSF